MSIDMGAAPHPARIAEFDGKAETASKPPEWRAVKMLNHG